MIASDNVYTIDLTVANGASVSSSHDARGHILAGLIIPAAITSTTLGLAFSQDGTNFVPVHDQAGNTITIPVAASRFVAFNLTTIAALPGIIRLTCGSAEAAARTIRAVFRPLG